MRKKIVAGNWKLNCLKKDASSLTADILSQLKNEKVRADVVILSPPFPFISMLVEMVAGNSFIKVAAQNCADKPSGAFTGEVSAAMIHSTGAHYVIIGHSERRSYYHETDEIVAAKVKLVLENSMTPIFCCGELLEQRKAGKHFELVKKQIETGLFKLTDDQFGKVVIAYEPVWAIGTGETATPEQAQEMHAFIRSIVEKQYGSSIAGNISILYGGSCNEKNAAELFALPDVDGGLIGGASLKATGFIGIIQSFSS